MPTRGIYSDVTLPYLTLFSETRLQDVFAFLHQNNNKLHYFLLIAYYEQASCRVC